MSPDRVTAGSLTEVGPEGVGSTQGGGGDMEEVAFGWLLKVEGCSLVMRWQWGRRRTERSSEHRSMEV